MFRVVNTQTGAVSTGTTVMPLDDTIPQKTEGDEYMTLAITPTSATNELKIDVVAHVGRNTIGSVVGGLFQGSTGDALAGGWGTTIASNYITCLNFTHYMTAGTTSETTFKVRIGPNNTATVTFNGGNATRFLGGVCASSITITEIQI